MEIIQEALTNIGFNWQVALANFVNFLIIFWLLKRFAFKPIQEKIEARNSEIAKGIEHAREAQAKLDTAEKEYKEKIIEAKRDAHRIMEIAQKEKELVLVYAHEQAEKKTAEMIERAKDAAETEKEKMKQEFKKYAGDLSLSVAEKLVGESLDEQKSQRLVEKTLKDHA